MLVVDGGPAASAFRRAKWTAEIRRVAPDVRDVFADYVHLCVPHRALSVETSERLRALLTYGVEPHAPERVGWQFLVTPRPGTVSPWSSKATDIAHNCGLHEVARIERVVRYTLVAGVLSADEQAAVQKLLHDRMTETVLPTLSHAEVLFAVDEPKPLLRIDLDAGLAALERADRELGLALSPDELRYLLDAFDNLGRSPTDVELMMFAQANSEHCRHKIFNAAFTVDGADQDASLFEMIRHTHAVAKRRVLDPAAPGTVLSAYRDNAAVMHGYPGRRFLPEPDSGIYRFGRERPLHVLMKVETHNHPTAISPDPGAATGAGGEIRDEGATGRGGKPKAGMCGFTVSHLRLPSLPQPWEAADPGRPDRIASPLQIMLEGPIGAASYANEFGRPNLCGWFRTFEQHVDGQWRGYHKPILAAGGYGNIAPEHVEKDAIPAGAAILVLGGPAMRIGLGGGAASSMAQGASAAELDFASVQRANAELERRCQEVLDRCQALGVYNPILSVHDVGAGGLSNALPELVHGAGRGAEFDLRAIPNAEPGMTPLEIWCNEAQERYVLAIRPEELPRFEAICARERAPYAVIGAATAAPHLRVNDPHFGQPAVDLPLGVLLGDPPRMRRSAQRRPAPRVPFVTSDLGLAESALRVLRFPAVADKSFLITIGDRSITGQVVRDPMVGPWQVPVADAAVTTATYEGVHGEAMAIGERTPLALLDGPASGRMAIGEALTNLAAASLVHLNRVSLSLNWMAAAGHAGEDAKLYDTVRAVAMELCPALGVQVPVGKDSMSMRTSWGQGSVVSPLSMVATAFAPVDDVTRTLTPQLRLDRGPTELLLIDLGAGADRLGGSVLAQVYGQLGDHPPDLDDPAVLVRVYDALHELQQDDRVLAAHDRSDGGLFVTLCEMAFAGRCGLHVALSGPEPFGPLFSEELGLVIQVRAADLQATLATFERHGLSALVRPIARPVPEQVLEIHQRAELLLQADLRELHRVWSTVSHELQRLRDEPDCADQAFDGLLDAADPGLVAHLTFDPAIDPTAHLTGRPRVAILREQGVNGQIEMAAAFDRAGFEAVDVHMTDLAQGRVDLATFTGLAACGGFSYGDVLGAGGGWARSILFQPRVRDQFEAYFTRPDTFTLGVCNGCQMLTTLRELIPGAERWPRFVRNRSEQFEARLTAVRIEPSPSWLLGSMAGSVLLVPTAHGEGRAMFDSEADHDHVVLTRLVAARFVDGRGEATERYPANPNGSSGGLTGLTTPDGRVTVLMPHPERVFRWHTLSWCPDDWRTPSADSPWMRMFRNARARLG